MKYKVLILAGLLIIGGVTANFISKERLLAPIDTSTSTPPVVTSTTTTNTGTGGGGVACTMEAKLCPDGSYVGRTGPKCEFTPCPQSAASGIEGKVLLGPTCPVMRDPPDQQCADRLFQTNLVLTTSDGARVVKSFSSNAKGEFRVSAPPGFYLIRSTPGGPVMPTCSKDPALEVKANAYTETTVYCDTGIR